MKLLRVFAATAVLVAMSACQATQPPPGTPSYKVEWNPTARSNVDPAAALTTYGPVLDALAQAAGSAWTWEQATTRTARFRDHCVVVVSRAGKGSEPGDVNGLLAQLRPVAAAHGFGNLRIENSPGGALTFADVDSSGAFLQFQSRGQATLSVSVPTTASC